MYQSELEHAFKQDMVPALVKRGITLNPLWEQRLHHPIEADGVKIQAKYGVMPIVIHLYVVGGIFYGHINAEHCTYALMKWQWRPVSGTRIDSDFDVAYLVKGDPVDSPRPTGVPGLSSMQGPTVIARAKQGSGIFGSLKGGLIP
jgi:hypothetical protein